MYWSPGGHGNPHEPSGTTKVSRTSLQNPLTKALGGHRHLPYTVLPLASAGNFQPYWDDSHCWLWGRRLADKPFLNSPVCHLWCSIINTWNAKMQSPWPGIYMTALFVQQWKPVEEQCQGAGKCMKPEGAVLLFCPSKWNKTKILYTENLYRKNK